MPAPLRRSGFTNAFFPKYASGVYYFAGGTAANATSATLGNNTLRSTLVYVPTEVQLVRLGAEFAVAGDAASVLRIGIHACNDIGAPETLILDAGTISTGTGDAGTVATGGTPGVYEIVISQWLQRGLYFFGGVVQGAPGTQPTIRTANSNQLPTTLSFNTVPPSAAAGQQAWVTTSVSGALPAPAVGGTGTGGAAPRLHFKVA